MGFEALLQARRQPARWWSQGERSALAQSFQDGDGRAVDRDRDGRVEVRGEVNRVLDLMRATGSAVGQDSGLVAASR
jgi:hypothetical protein